MGGSSRTNKTYFLVTPQVNHNGFTYNDLVQYSAVISCVLMVPILSFFLISVSLPHCHSPCQLSIIQEVHLELSEVKGLVFVK